MSCDLFSLATIGVSGLTPYRPGKSIMELQRELGLDEIIKLASNENPLGPSQSVLDAINTSKDLSRYPDGDGFNLKKKLASKHNVKTENITLGNLLMEKNELLYAGVLSSGIAFLLQALSQQNLSPAPVAIIFSLEGVFAAIFGWLLLNQFLSGVKIFGIFLILTAVIFSQLLPTYDKRKHGRS